MADPEARVFWIDENLPPALAEWFSSRSGLRGEHFRTLALSETPDRDIFLQARRDGAVIVTKDEDFANLVAALGPPPQVVWVRTGNVRTSTLLELFGGRLDALRERLDAGDPLVAVE